MKSEDISVDLRLARIEGKVRAYADVTIPLGADGLLQISGFSVIVSSGALPRAVPPARKGEHRYFDVIGLIGKIRGLVDTAILAEYERQTRLAAKN